MRYLFLLLFLAGCAAEQSFPVEAHIGFVKGTTIKDISTLTYLLQEDGIRFCGTVTPDSLSGYFWSKGSVNIEKSIERGLLESHLIEKVSDYRIETEHELKPE